MDSMELEREKGITIQSAATYTTWGDHSINLIDTPGHVDFTIEVERALRVLDGAVLVLCAVSGVQSQTITVDRQMRRYEVPRISFVNKMDRAGANPQRIVEQIRQKLKMPAAMIQLPIGAEDEFRGVVDLVRMRAIYNEGIKGSTVVEKDVPQELQEAANERRSELFATLADVDEEMGDLLLAEEEPTNEQLAAAIRRATIARTFSPVLMGSAVRDKSVQPLLDAICAYLPNPREVQSHALNLKDNEAQVPLHPHTEMPFVGLAFKLEEGRYGQLTYVKVYQGRLVKGQYATHVKSGKKVKIARLVRMHSDEMEEVDSVESGEICALFGIDCASGDTFTDGTVKYSMTSMFVPEPVISLSLTPTNKDTGNFSKALNRFQREDPTFRVHMDPESKETIISGMGELHLDIYVERMRREYRVDCVTGKPRVAFRETITQGAPFNYTHKKQSGGSGQYGRVIGKIEPLTVEEAKEITEEGEDLKTHEFCNRMIGTNIPHAFIPACERGFEDALEKGSLIGHPVTGVRMILEDGLAHAVDSNEMAFRLAASGAFREAYKQAKPIVLEPIMAVSVTAPVEFQGAVLSSINKRKGIILDTEVHEDYFHASVEAPLNNMFGYSTDIRSSTQVRRGEGGERDGSHHHSPPLHPLTRTEPL